MLHLQLNYCAATVRDMLSHTDTTSTKRDSTSTHRRGLTLVATSLGFAVVQLDVSVVNVAIKPIGAALGGDISALQWVVNAYTVAFAALILSAGALGDRIGAKRVFIAGFALFTAASGVCGLAPALGVLIGARALQGAGAALLAPCSLTLLNHAYPEARERGRAIGRWALGASAALSAGPVIGGVLTAALGWRAIFFINAPIGLTGILLTASFASETTRSTDRGVDPWGQLAAIVALTSLAAATIQGGAAGFASAGALGGYAVAGVAAILFLIVEARRARPMLPLRLFRCERFSANTAIGLLINVAFYGLIFVFSLFFQRAQHFSALQAGLAFAPMTGAIMVANALAGRLDDRLGARAVIAGGALLMAAGAAALEGIGAHSAFSGLVAQLVSLGFGLGLIVPVMTSGVLGSVERSRSGIAAGTLNTARQTGSVIGVALFGSLIAGGRLVPGMHVALAVALVLSLAVALLGARTSPPQT
jgi:DHA2 family methylenomycin A resistance protein-like MFS transporter